MCVPDRESERGTPKRYQHSGLLDSHHTTRGHQHYGPEAQGGWRGHGGEQRGGWPQSWRGEGQGRQDGGNKQRGIGGQRRMGDGVGVNRRGRGAEDGRWGTEEDRGGGLRIEEDEEGQKMDRGQRMNDGGQRRTGDRGEAGVQEMDGEQRRIDGD